ncbi:uncharacterized protein LOC105840106 isoform X2 [Monomorium pharaonis]|uniref:uncharacterized protein LOC105840106 isoform X2 n=1 Tax=Monomorium pharaonis TaxID=307658 RepID=UPI00102E1F7F|nr:uncharacterized protein LOC105840106 isoform X2 [Monomorium pharaonis]
MSGASTDEVYKPTWWLFEDMSFLSAHVAARSGKSSLIVIAKNIYCYYKNCNFQTTYFNSNLLQHSNKQSDVPPTNVTNIINDSSVEELQYTEICDLINKNNAVKDYDNNSHSPTFSGSSSSKLSSRTERNKKKKEVETSDARLNFWKAASQTLINISDDNDNVTDGIHHWILYLESELRKIKDRKRLKRLQRKIIDLIDDEDN